MLAKRAEELMVMLLLALILSGSFYALTRVVDWRARIIVDQAIKNFCAEKK